MIKRQSVKELFSESLIELAGNKSVAKITVKDIVENCNSSTATFYRNFHDKFELISWIFAHSTEEIYTNILDGELSWNEAMLQIIGIMDERRDFYTNALKATSGIDSFLFYANEKSELTLTEYVAKSTGGSVDDQILFDIHFYLMACTSVAVEWFIKLKPYTREQLVYYLTCAMPEDLKKYLLIDENMKN